MAFRRPNPHRDLERRLRAERPQARDELVRMLSGEPAAKPARQRGRAMPRLAALGAATALLGASLGVAGALGSVSHSFQTFGSNIVHIVWTNSGGSDTDNNYGKDPFDYQYHHNVPICDPNGNLVYVSFWEWLQDIKNGYTPAHWSRKHHDFYCKTT